MEETFSEPCDLYYTIFTKEDDKAYKYRFLSPFEFKNTLISEAKKTSCKALPFIDTGRGNPNFYSAVPRKAFALLTILCVDMGLENPRENDLAFMPEKRRISDIFYKRLRKIGPSPEAKFLKKAIPKMQNITKMGRDEFVHDLVISTVGCFYPDPPRIQRFVEPVLTKFLQEIIIKPDRPYMTKEKTERGGTCVVKTTTDLFLTEGATAAIVYVFNSLKYNRLLNKGDKIGIVTPIFSPYLEIPHLNNYDLEVLCVKSEMGNGWEIPDEDIEKIKGKEMKALFLVNPGNPSSTSLSVKTVSKIKRAVLKHNRDLIILSDIVYAPFVDEFNTLTNALPRNCITVYSFSKYFGVTGWRLGSILMSKNNIVDSRLLKDSPKEVEDRYKMITTEPSKIKFIDRLLMDSRQVAEAHTAGLSTPQQVLMSLFAAYDFMDKKRVYNEKLKSLLLERMDCLSETLGYDFAETPLSANYYAVIDLLRVAHNFGPGLADHLKNNLDPLEFVLRLAKEYATVVLPGVGFGAPFWTVRISLANTVGDDYVSVGENIKNLMEKYKKNYVNKISG